MCYCEKPVFTLSSLYSFLQFSVKFDDFSVLFLIFLFIFCCFYNFLRFIVFFSLFFIIFFKFLIIFLFLFPNLFSSSKATFLACVRCFYYFMPSLRPLRYKSSMIFQTFFLNFVHFSSLCSFFHIFSIFYHQFKFFSHQTLPPNHSNQKFFTFSPIHRNLSLKKSIPNRRNYSRWLR